MKASLLLAGLLVAGGVMQSAPATASPAPKPLVVEIKNAAGQSVGTATLTDAAPGVRIKLDIRSLPPGEHSIHIHQVAKCDPPDFKSAGLLFWRPAAMNTEQERQRAFRLRVGGCRGWNRARLGGRN